MPSGTTTIKKKTSSKTSANKTKPKASNKLTSSTSKASSSRSTTKLTKKDEEIIKKRLKKLLQREGVNKSTPKPSAKKSTSGCNTVSCFSTDAKKAKAALSSSKSPSCSSGQCYFTKKDGNAKNKTNGSKPKTTDTKKKTNDKPKSSTTKAGGKKKSSSSTSTQYSCSNGKCTLKSKPSTSKPKGVKCTSEGCFFLKPSTKATAKTNSTKTVAKRKAPEITPKTVPAKKSKSSNAKSLPIKKSKTTLKPKVSDPPKKTCNINNNQKGPLKKSSQLRCSPCTPCSTTNSEDDEYSEESDFTFSEESDFTFSDDSDEDDGDDKQTYNGPTSRGFSKRNQDSYDSWETSSEESFVCKGGGCPFVKKRDHLHNDNNGETKAVETNTESALVPLHWNNDLECLDSNDRDYEIERATDYSDEYDSEEEESEEEDMSYEDSEYSPSDYSASENSFSESSDDDDDYQLPDSEPEDLYIQKGEARIYPISKEEVDFDSDASSIQLIEIPPIMILKQNASNFKKDVRSESDDSCPQLVPIQDSTEQSTFKANEFFHFSDSKSEHEREKTPRLVAHIFEGVKEKSERDDLGISLASVSKKYNECIVDENVSLRPFDKILGKTLNLNSSNYKIVTIHKESILEEEAIPTGDFTDSRKDHVKEPCKMMAHIFKVHKEKTHHEFQPQAANKSSEGTYIEMIPETPAELSPLERIANISDVYDTTKYEIITTRPTNLNKCITNTIEHEKCTNNIPQFFSKFYNAIDSRHVLLLLKETFYIYGTLKIKLIAGGVDIFGFNPDINEVCDIFSPRGYSFLYMKPGKGKNVSKNITNELEYLSNNFMRSDLVEILELFDESVDAIILLERNDHNKRVEIVKKYMNENLFPNMNCITLERPFYASEFILRCLLYKNSKNALNINPHWASVNITKASKVLVVGGKGVGKSTLVRYLINRNFRKFKKFLLIDLDIGQPEVFVPQTVSATLIEKPLLGPGYFYGLKPEKAYLFGDINVVLSPISYFRKVKELIEWCKKEERLKNIPWIINTMGYNKGFGNELISVIAQLLEPSDIIQIQSSREINNFDFILTSEVIKSIPKNIFPAEISNEELKHKLVLFESEMMKNIRSNDWDMTAKDMRLAIIISRLGDILTGRSEWLSDVKPVCARFEDLDVICFSEDDVEKENLLDVINANLVYLCDKTDNVISCQGIGVVRGVDRYQQKIYLLPSIPLISLTNVNCLAVCNIPLPTSVILNQGPKIKDIAPYTYNTNDFIASKHINQIYYRPQQFLVGSHRNVM